MKKTLKKHKTTGPVDPKSLGTGKHMEMGKKAAEWLQSKMSESGKRKININNMPVPKKPSKEVTAKTQVARKGGPKKQLPKHQTTAQVLDNPRGNAVSYSQAAAPLNPQAAQALTNRRAYETKVSGMGVDRDTARSMMKEYDTKNNTPTGLRYGQTGLKFKKGGSTSKMKSKPSKKK